MLKPELMEYKVYEIAEGEINIWISARGNIVFNSKAHQPISLSSHEALEFANTLITLVRQAQE